MSFRKITIVLILLRFLKIGLSLITLSITAKYFGVSVEMDSWIIATSFMATLSLAMWGPLNESFRAKFIFLRETEGEESSMNRVRSLLIYIVVLTLVVSLFLVLFARSIVPYLAPSIDGEAKTGFLALLVYLIPLFLINELTSIGTSLLNAYDMFYLPDVLGVVSALINLLSIFFLSSSFGITSILFGLYLSSVVLFLLLFLSLRSSVGLLFYNEFSVKWSSVKPFVYFSLPFFIPYFISQFQFLLERSLANSLGSGVVSVLNYSSQFKSIIQAVITSVLLTVMVPRLSFGYARNNLKEFNDVLVENIHIIFTILALVIPFLIGAADQITDILFNNGVMTDYIIMEITSLSRLYSFSIIGVMLYLVFGFSLLCQKQEVKYAIYGSMAQIITICVNLIFFESLGIMVFPFSLFGSHLLVSIFMFRNLNLVDKRSLALAIIKYLFLIGALCVVLFLLSDVIRASTLTSLFQLLIKGFLLIVFYFVLSSVLGLSIFSKFNLNYLRRF